MVECLPCKSKALWLGSFLIWQGLGRGLGQGLGRGGGNDKKTKQNNNKNRNPSNPKNQKPPNHPKVTQIRACASVDFM